MGVAGAVKQSTGDFNSGKHRLTWLIQVLFVSGITCEIAVQCFRLRSQQTQTTMSEACVCACACVCVCVCVWNARAKGAGRQGENRRALAYQDDRDESNEQNNEHCSVHNRQPVDLQSG